MTQNIIPVLSETAIQQLLASLDLPVALSIRKLDATAAYHSIYILQFASKDAPTLVPDRSSVPDGLVDLILRVSGNHLPRIKTLNEVACMRWVRSATTIPVPALVRFDAFTDNPINHEFMLLERVPGISVDQIYDQLDDRAKRYLISQLTDYLTQLQEHAWDHVGGLSIVGDKVVPGPVLDETFWQTPDIGKYWDAGETAESLNIAGPYNTYADYAIACLRKYSQNIEKHSSLASYRDLLPRLNALIERLQDDPAKTDDIKYIFAHKDLHFANIMCDPATATITGTLDWEFSGVVPAPLWNPSKAFLWNGKSTAEAKRERDRMFEIFNEQQFTDILGAVDPNAVQMALGKILTYVRALVYVCPRGQREDERAGWRATVEASLKCFDV
ncbi:uncharacterized protein N0V89_004508 [Didymosphaeria variabile]|uniref:Aminoglycoside phosphotransferase domain-containing protein n=1 Tax=Didymosphaeria variabile TaxID=1932322 RepID=A0A9W8XPK3_9PLEO|nr:uncharacterized protein N0V89_004508 [Didymosphaeria variabile]KAJ4356475.1 hypothetical protein N0V89_004508 [Didymosphaeria variabile]